MFDRFTEVVVLDTEFHTGQREGNRPVPVCLCAKELRSGRIHRIWLDDVEARPNPLPPDALYVAYSASAEWGCYLAQGWELPRYVCDLFFEFRCLTNGKAKNVGDSMIDALSYYGLPSVTSFYKQDMRERSCAAGISATMNENLFLITVRATSRRLRGCFRQCTLVSACLRRWREVDTRWPLRGWNGTAFPLMCLY